MTSRSSRRPRALVAVAAVLLGAGGLAAVTLADTGPVPTTDAGTMAAPVPAPPFTGCSYRPRSTAVRRGPTDRRRVALTFDDGPSAYTARILAVLEREHVPATFFVVGRNVAGNEGLLRRMLADGDMIGNHSFTHADLSGAGPDAVTEIDDTQAAIRNATGFTPCLLRPPYGLASKRLLGVLADRRLTSVLWSVNPRDYQRPGTAAIVKRVSAGARPGAVILDHDGGGDRTQTAAALPKIIRGLKRRGYRFVTVTDLLGMRTIR